MGSAPGVSAQAAGHGPALGRELVDPGPGEVEADEGQEAHILQALQQVVAGVPGPADDGVAAVFFSCIIFLRSE